MEIVLNYNHKNKWDDFISAYSRPAAFLQSYDWGEFNQKILGHEVKRLALVENGEIKLALSAIKKNLPFNKFYFYIPRGPVAQTKPNAPALADCAHLHAKIKSEFKQAIFSRFCPPELAKNSAPQFVRAMGYSQPQILTTSREPCQTILLDLQPNRELLLKQMSQKTRYNINLAQKKGVRIRSLDRASRVKDNQIFYALSRAMAKRNKVKIYDQHYYAKLVDFFFAAPDGPRIKMYLAEYTASPLAAILVFYFGNTATYLHGASSDDHRELMPNHLLQWTALTDAQAAGMKIYDFWGVDEKRWPGLTRFKRGFGGTEVAFGSAWDYVLNKKWYAILKIMKHLNKIKNTLIR